MKKTVLTVVLLVLTMGLGGCIVSAKGDGCQPQKAVHHSKIDTTIAEIDAVKMLGSESARLNVLKVIAGRPGLSPKARLHLIESITLLGSESSREVVLLALSRNPAVASETETYVVEVQSDQYTSVTKGEIDAVRSLGTNNSRESAYLSFASHPNLSSSARGYLAKAVKNLGTNDSREKVLLTLAKNDCSISRQGVTVDEIDAVRSLGTNDSRRNVYVAQAQHPYLSSETRSHLAKAIQNLGTNSSREQVLMALGKPRMTSASKSSN